jgi:RimJ/RimL family protein N-acetyltransferase
VTAGPRIETERLVLTPLRAGDADALFAYRSLPDVRRFQTWEPSVLEDADAFIAELAATAWDTPGTWFQLGVRRRDTGELIGDLGVHFLEDGEQAEIGFTLAPSAQGQGFAAEALTALLRYLFRACGKHRVTASADPRNAKSMALLARMGMRREAHFVRSLWFKGEWADDVVFAILDTEFEAAG